jgi:hypothetical protein
MLGDCCPCYPPQPPPAAAGVGLSELSAVDPVREVSKGIGCVAFDSWDCKLWKTLTDLPKQKRKGLAGKNILRLPMLACN